tara:strand:+ start:869 stop:1324 length:456 start_codon:yes stop_codon:yes gene_type:complete
MNKYSFLIFISVLAHSSISYSACNIINGKKHGDCQNVTVNVIDNPKSLVISNGQILSGIVKDVHVLSDGILSFGGICYGDMIVEKGGELTLTGIVNGTITNNGGTVLIGGIAHSVFAKSGITRITGVAKVIYGEGQIEVEAGALINGMLQE